MTNEDRRGRVERFINTLNQSRALGLTVEEATEDHLILRLPYSEQIIGDPATGVIHGGAITTLMDTASGSVKLCVLPEFELCPTLDLRVDYMRSATPGLPVYAKAVAHRITKNIIFTRCEAYQDSGETIANCVAAFMRIDSKALPKAFRDLIVGGKA